MRCLVSLFAILAVAAPGLAQPVNLTEKVAAGDRAKCSLELELKGNLQVIQEGTKQSIRLEAKARHVFAERIVAVGDGFASTSARFYSDAVASAVVAGEKSDRKLPDDRRLIVARRKPDGLVCFAPAGALARDDLDLVTEHFNPQCLPGLLPGKIVNVGDTWTVGDSAAQAACLFHAILKNGLVGKLVSAKDGVATFSIEGKAEGIENGAKVTLEVTATGTFDVATSRVTASDLEAEGPARAGRGEPRVGSRSRGRAQARAARFIAEGTVGRGRVGITRRRRAAKFTDLKLADPKGRYHITHARDWYVTGQSDTHLVLRLIEKGEFVAQATVMVWRKVDAGKHSPADEFKKAVANAPGWVPGKVLAEGELPAGGGAARARAAGSIAPRSKGRSTTNPRCKPSTSSPARKATRSRSRSSRNRTSSRQSSPATRSWSRRLSLGRSDFAKLSLPRRGCIPQPRVARLCERTLGCRCATR